MRASLLSFMRARTSPDDNDNDSAPSSIHTQTTGQQQGPPGAEQTLRSRCGLRVQSRSHPAVAAPGRGCSSKYSTSSTSGLPRCIRGGQAQRDRRMPAKLRQGNGASACYIPSRKASRHRPPKRDALRDDSDYGRTIRKSYAPRHFISRTCVLLPWLRLQLQLQNNSNLTATAT